MSQLHMSELRLNTDQAQRIIKRLSNHWRHKFEIYNEADTTVIPFSQNSSVRLDAEAQALVAKIETKDADRLDQLENVVLVHINRMANQEFTGEWQRL